MGFYIHSCLKMNYKTSYQPSYLLDPPTNKFYPWSEAKPRLDKRKHAVFSLPLDEQPPSPLSSAPQSPASHASASDATSEDDDADVDWPDTPPPGCLDPNALPKELLFGTVLLEGSTLVPLLFSSAWHDEDESEKIKQLLAATGQAFAGRIAIWV